MTAAKKISPTSSILRDGDRAPSCDLTITGDQRINLSSYQGKKNVVLYFYPKDDTPGCTTEAKDFSALHSDFESADTVVIGISKCEMKSHDKFKEKYSLPFGLASDAKTDTAEQFGVWGEKSMYGKTYMGIVRSTFLIDKTGKIAKAWPKVSVTGHAAEVLKEAQKLQ